MSLLAPLYIAGILAVGLPILFHLIKRTPQGRQAFSSIMFLTPSPPRITRRSRLTNILLLILRATALTLLALAFARPFLRQTAQADVSPGQGRRIAILVDTSASMQRGDLWQQAGTQVQQVLDELKPEDEASLFFFDETARPAFTFSEWNQTELSQRVPLLKARMAQAKPTFAATNIGSALATVADQLGESQTDSKGAIDTTPRTLILVSDMQQGGHAEALQGHQWPDNVALEVKPVAAREQSNASAQWLKDTAEISEADADRIRVRVSSQQGSTHDQLSIAWGTATGPIPTLEPMKMYVPPGRSQVVRVPIPSPELNADRLLLNGDECDFDNALFLVPPRQDQVRVVMLSEDATDDLKGLRYYFDSATAPTPQRKVEVVGRKSDEPLVDADLAGARLAVVSTSLSDDRAQRLGRFIEGGGDVFWVFKDAATAGGLGQLMQGDAPAVEESPATGYVLISRVEYGHPLFAPFADARFADFTKIHFWKHRRMSVPENGPMRVLAWFDNGDPFLLQQDIGKGRLIIATAGWQPADSQLALSTKFVPLIDGLLKRRDGALVEAQYDVHEAIALPPVPTQGSRSLKGPDGSQIEIAAAASTFDGADKPGVYQLTLGQRQIPIAVNIAADESRTTPLAIEELEQWGVRLGAKPQSAETVARERHLQVVELENKQKLWRWVIVVVLGVLVAETALAGRLSHRTLEEQVTT